MPLDDEQIERYSRQLILQEVGPRGQERLLAARVAIIGTDHAAERVVAYLAAAGVGAILAAPELRRAIDPAQPDCTFLPLAEDDRVDLVVVSRSTPDAAAAALAAWRERAPIRLWIVAGHAGAVPPCPSCGIAGRTPREVAPSLTTLRDTCLGTIVATEAVKALLGIGSGLAGRVLAYDPATATIETVPAITRGDCTCATA